MIYLCTLFVTALPFIYGNWEEMVFCQVTCETPGFSFGKVVLQKNYNLFDIVWYRSENIWLSICHEDLWICMDRKNWTNCREIVGNNGLFSFDKFIRISFLFNLAFSDRCKTHLFLTTQHRVTWAVRKTRQRLLFILGWTYTRAEVHGYIEGLKHIQVFCSLCR